MRGPDPERDRAVQRDVVVDVRAQQGAGRGPAGCCAGRGPRRAGAERRDEVRQRQRAVSSTVPVPSASGTNAVRCRPQACSAATAPPGSGSAGRRAAPRQGPSCAVGRELLETGEDGALRPPPGSSTTWAPSAVANVRGSRRSAVTTWTCRGGTVCATAVIVSRPNACARSARRTPGGGCSRLLAAEEPLTGTTIRQVALSGCAHRDDRLRLGAPASTPTPPGGEDDRHTDGSARAGAAGTSHGEGRQCAADTPGSAAAVVLPVRCGPAAAADAAADPPRLARRRAPARADGGFVVEPQPHLVRRPARLRPLPVRQRPPAVLPRPRTSVFRIPVVGRMLAQRRADPGLPRAPATRPRPSAPRWTAVRRGQVRRDLPRGHPDPRPRPVADERQDRRRPGRADHRVPADPGRAVGAAGDPRALRPAARGSSRARRCTCAPGRPVDLADLYGRPLDARACCARPPTGSWTRSPRCWRRSAASRRPAERFDTRGAGVAETGDPRRATASTGTGADRACPDGEDRSDDARSRARHRQLGHGVRRGAGRRRRRGADVGPTRRGGRPDQRTARNADYLPGPRAAARRSRATTDPAEARRRAPRSSCSRCRRRRCAANLAGWADAAAGRRRRRLPDEGRRARHDQADERGHRRGRRRRRPSASPSCPAPTWPARSPPRQPAAQRRRLRRRGDGRARRGRRARRRTSGPTPTPTSSASSSAAR